ncbi:MAG TPA: hypothetical protein EYH36_07565 [Desulfocapsa sulfexigens]|nr:hypothetical protein [Desulfocapsa sulfexigens]
MKTSLKVMLSILFVFTFTIASPNRGQGQVKLLNQTETTVDFKLQGYAGLKNIEIFSGSLPAGGSRSVEVSYTGLAMLVFSGGQQYPIIVGSKSDVVTITDVRESPSFTAGGDNRLFYRLLMSGDELVEDEGEYGFVRKMLQGKKLLDSSSSIKTVEELQDKKREFQEFIKQNYQDLFRSDLLRRLIGQFFMMHEYVSYHREDSSASDIQLRYRREVVSGVKSLLTILQDHIPENELLNYCVGLYYDRGMVTLAAFIIDNFKEISNCAEVDGRQKSDFSADLKLVNADGSAAGVLGALKDEKVFISVSLKCPVSMVKAVIKARELSSQNSSKVLIVVPMGTLTAKHRGMSRNVSGARMLYVAETLAL